MFDRAETRDSGMLAVDDGHEIYWEEAGNPAGTPAVYLHGGPGGTLGTGDYRKAFDPSRFRIIGLDQRGCGRSTPHVTVPGYDLNRNTTAHLIDDLERLREHLHVDRWLVNGASWGSTLALAYAQTHPERVLGIVAVAVTTTDRSQVDWITETVGAIFPEAWQRLADHAEQADIGYRRDHDRIVEAYAQLMTHPDPATRDAASHAWAEWEDHHISIGTGGVRRDPRWEDDEYRHVFATLVTHYWAHDAFLAPPILERMDRLVGVPATLIHGRRDVSGPAITPWRLHQAWPGSELLIDEGQGHGGETMTEAWCSANTRHVDEAGSGPS
ncbi:prolyl aminopeptidase [Actinopolyspora saharensis]|uniref:Proline iminopeptidase n=1 Tax=Actinopolyspora saharensis TaxID=995062 RepID=A0A1H0ZK71_9ACTN|nr:prolyl aminopeptidase [Actinopolyspora saharensis]SDQ27895.1 proline iminopeptidase [Actinopolyspora saharensis]